MTKKTNTPQDRHINQTFRRRSPSKTNESNQEKKIWDKFLATMVVTVPHVYCFSVQQQQQ
jgi:hypothetical protein